MISLRRTALVPALATTALLGTALESEAGDWAHAREGFTIGFNVGGGTAAVNPDDSDESSDRTGGGAGGFRIGYAVSPQVVLALEGNGWTKDQNGITTTFTIGGLGATWYPGEGGFFVRGIVGAGRVTFGANVLGTNVEVSENGGGVGIGGGYEWRLTRTFALGPAVDYGFASFDGGDANWVNGTLGLHWYL